MKEGPVSNFPGSSSSKIGVPPVENAISTIVFSMVGVKIGAGN
jgi:hypothetical protein